MALLSIAVLVKNAWVAEDAFIVFRVIEHLWAGNGAVFNVAERVQVYTSPLWFLLLAGGRAFVADPFVLVLGTSLLLWLALLAGLRSLLRDRYLFVAGVLVLPLSSSFFDFAASGLENPLAYAVLVWTVIAFVQLHWDPASNDPSERVWERALGKFVLGVGLALTIRHDLLTLLAIPTLYTLFRAHRLVSSRRLLGLAVLGAAPLAAWTLFAVAYYGFPFPNTAYAKLPTGVGRLDLVTQGAKYLVDTTRFDTVTTVVLIAALLVSGAPRTSVPLRVLGAGVATNLAYVVWVGGDFMRGRFLSFAFLIAWVICLLALRDLGTERHRRAVGAAIAATILLTVFTPWPPSPLTHPPRHLDNSFSWGITDERAFFFGSHRVLDNLPWGRPADQDSPISRHHFSTDGRAFRDSGLDIAVANSIGTFAYFAKPDQHVIDVLALSDPLLARLPAIKPWRPGHFRRWLPRGYLTSLATDSNQIEDPAVRALYRDLRLATRAPLGSKERWWAILRLNLSKRWSEGIDSYRVDDASIPSTIYREEISGHIEPPLDRRPGGQ